MMTYLFWPNPPAPAYDAPKVLVLLLLCSGLVVASFAVKYWRKRLSNAVTRKLTRSYASALFWFGASGLFLVVCRVEGISYLSMRVWWIVWALAVLITVVFHFNVFRTRHYAIIPQTTGPGDPREKYLPKKRRK